MPIPLLKTYHKTVLSDKEPGTAEQALYNTIQNPTASSKALQYQDITHTQSPPPHTQS